MNKISTEGFQAAAPIAETGEVPYLRNAWYPACWSRDLGETPMPLMLLEQETVLYRTESGAPALLGNRCPHRFVELHRGKVVGENIQCPYHGLQFGPSGACGHNPHGPTRPAAARVRSYPVVDRHGLVWAWMGEPEKADPALIPDYSIIEDAGHKAVGGMIHVAGDYQLYSDNLLDLSHTEFTHPNLMQPGSLDRSTFQVLHEGDKVEFIRRSPKEAAVGTFQRMLCEGNGGKAGDIVSTSHAIRWEAPARMYVEIIQRRDEVKTNFTQIHIAVPTRRSECQLIWASIRDFNLDDAELDAYISGGMTHILGTEDIPMIESQETFTRGRDFVALKPVLLSTDEAPVRARRILARLIREERLAEDIAA
ncbi:MAG: vanillate monooxygenase [Bradyrhizobium sp.]|nr:vanillate monooxygenase [Bradyrhizobium sp.]